MPRKTTGVYRRWKTWWITWNDASGKRHRERVGHSQTEAIKVRAMRLAGQMPLPKTMTFGEFVQQHWRPEAKVALKQSTLRGYETSLRHHLLPYFGDHPLSAITRAEVKRFILEKSSQQRFAYSKDPNPNRPVLSPKTIKNAVGLLVSIVESATIDYGLMESNPVRGMLRRRHFPAARDDRPKRSRTSGFRSSGSAT